MSIKLERLSDPSKGQDQTFADDRERIVIGRDASQCDFVFSPDLTMVGREHCALIRQISGDYELDTFGEHYVEINGQPATAGAAVPTAAILSFGRHGGPRLRATIDRSSTSPNLSATVAQQAVPSLWSSLRATRAVVGIAFLLILIIGGGLVLEARRMYADEAMRTALTGQIGTLAALQKQQNAQMISVRERDHLAQVVYAVVLRDAAGAERLLGSSWAVAPHRLATNAHVALEFDTLKPGEAMVVRPPGDANVAFAVKTIKVHPGYKAFDHFVSDDTLFIKNYGGWGRVGTVGGYDVALLDVDDTLPPSSVLQVAGQDEIDRMNAGDPLAYAGFPYENIEGATVQALGRTPQVQVGNVTAMTDYFLLPASFKERYLVEHNLPATGGASGSPIVNAAGHVVALLSAINITSLKDQRIPSAALINYGQRVDVLISLLSGQADAQVATDQGYWAQQTSNFKRGADVIIDGVLSRDKPQRNAKAVLDTSSVGAISKADRVAIKNNDGKPITIRYKLIKIAPAPGSRHFVIAYGKDLSPIAAIDLVQNGKILSRNEGRGSPWAGIDFTTPPDGGLSILVEMGDFDMELVVRDYVWDMSAS